MLRPGEIFSETAMLLQFLFVLVFSVLFLFILVHFCSFLFILVHSCSFLFILVHSCIPLFILGHYCLFLFILVKTHGDSRGYALTSRENGSSMCNKSAASALPLVLRMLGPGEISSQKLECDCNSCLLLFVLVHSC